MPLQRPIADSRASHNIATLQTDSAFKSKHSGFDVQAPRAFDQGRSSADSQAQQEEYYKKHSYLMEDPTNKLITDAMLHGRKDNGTLESWAQSRSTNLLDSENPSKMLVQ